MLTATFIALHALQVLDLAIYGPLKLALRDEALAYETNTGRPVDKDAALLVIGRAYKKAFTKSNILSAFRKAGIWPLDNNAIAASVVAPSQSTSVPTDAPAPLLTIVKKIIQAIDDLPPIPARNFGGSGRESLDPEISTKGKVAVHVPTLDTPAHSPQPPFSSLLSIRVQQYASATHNALIGSSYEHIVSASHVWSSNPQLPIPIRPESPIRKPHFELLQEEPAYEDFTKPELTKEIQRYRLELDIEHLHIGEMNSTISTYQTGLVLAGAHSRKQQRQLYTREEKAKKKKADMPIKPDASKGRIISSEEAEQYDCEVSS